MYLSFHFPPLPISISKSSPNPTPPQPPLPTTPFSPSIKNKLSINLIIDLWANKLPSLDMTSYFSHFLLFYFFFWKRKNTLTLSSAFSFFFKWKLLCQNIYSGTNMLWIQNNDNNIVTRRRNYEYFCHTTNIKMFPTSL